MRSVSRPVEWTHRDGSRSALRESLSYKITNFGLNGFGLWLRDSSIKAVGRIIDL